MKKWKKYEYPKGGDGMFFYHKKTKHPAKQMSHTEKTWANRRYTHKPNNMSNYIEDKELSTYDSPFIIIKVCLLISFILEEDHIKSKRKSVELNANC